ARSSCPRAGSGSGTGKRCPPRPSTVSNGPIMTAELVSVSPIDGSVVARRAYASDGEIARVLADARAAQGRWRELPLAARARDCTRFAQALVAARGAHAVET